MSLSLFDRGLKRGALVVAALGLLAGPVPFAAANQTLFYQVADGASDAEEGDDGPGVIDLTSSDLEITEDHADRPQLVGVRFDGIDLPRGTPILEAYLQFTTDEDDKNRNPFSVGVYAEAADDAQSFSETAYDISNRARSAASVTWGSHPDWTVEHESGPNQRTPDLTALVQEVINRGGWQAGNAMAFILDGVGTRTAESFEGSISEVEVADLAPRLVIRAASTEMYRVSASSDDAEEGDDGPGVLDLTSSDLELVQDHEDDPSRDQTVGIRFADVTIPAGAEIISAHLQFGVDEGDKNSDPFAVTITGEAADHAQTFVDEGYNISSRPRTGASVDWQDIPFWSMDLEGQPGGSDQRTPDLTAIVQEIVDRGGWEEGNAMAFILEGTGQRTAESFDGDKEFAPALYVTFIGEQASSPVDKVRLSWSDDPTTTMTVLWDQLRGSNAEVHYDLYDAAEGCSGDAADFAMSKPYDRANPYRGMNNHMAKLTGLASDTAYRFLVETSEGSSECSWFRTAPDTRKAFTYITGGDTKSSGSALEAGRWSNDMVAKLRPLFVFFTGDFNSGDGTNDLSWQTWLSDWSERTRSEDGRMYPIVAVHGNHEDGDFRVLYELFDSGNADPNQPADYSYYSLSIGGDLLHVINLNSQLYLNGIDGGEAHTKQTTWLEQDLAAHKDFTFKVAGAHKPIRPHTASKAENDFMLEWAELFDTYGLTIFNESDTHVHAYTFPLRRSDAPGNDMGFVRDDDNGVLYVGEGSWGASPRAVNDDKSFTLDSAPINQFKWVQVFPGDGVEPAGMDIRTVVTGRYENGVLANKAEGVEALTEDTRFQVPAGITLHETPFYGTVLEVPFEAVSGAPPLAPSNLQGEATSYSDISLSWVNNDKPLNVKGLEVWRKEGSGEWIRLATGLAPETTSYENSFLRDGTDYTYRVRGTNVFGDSPWSNEALVSTPEDNRIKATFQDGVDGYDGTTTLIIASASPDANFIDERVSVDGSTSDYGGSGVSQGLIRFDGVFGPGGVPADTVVSGAELRFYTKSFAAGPVGVFRMLTPWDGSVSWNSLTDGLTSNFDGSVGTSDGVAAAVTADDQFANVQDEAFAVFDVTASVKAWSEGAPNNGWGIINFRTDGWDFWTDAYTGAPEFRPQLTVFYSLAGDANGDGSVNRADVMAMRDFLRQPADACPACDLDGDGTITIHDARRLAMKVR